MSRRPGSPLPYTLNYLFVLAPIAPATDVVHISRQAKIGDDEEIKPGTYRVEVERNKNSAEVLFFQGEDLVAAARAKVCKEDVKSNHTEIHSEKVYGERIITKIWLQGWKESLVFKQDNSGTE